MGILKVIRGFGRERRGVLDGESRQGRSRLGSEGSAVNIEGIARPRREDRCQEEQKWVDCGEWRVAEGLGERR
eukprot:3075872-Rhodomonas_salina.2